MTAAALSTIVIASSHSVRLTITVFGAGAGETMTAFRRVGSGGWAPVMGAVAIPAVSRVLVDPEVPLNLAAYWRVEFSSGTQVATAYPVIVTATMATISHPVLGLTADCAVVERDDYSRSTRAEVLTVEGDPEPWVVWDVPVGKKMPVKLLTLTAAAESVVDAALATGDPLLLRCVCKMHLDRWVQPVDDETRVSRLVKRASDESRLWDLGSCVVYGSNPQLGVAARGNTLGTLYDAVNPKTLGAIADRWTALGYIAEADI